MKNNIKYNESSFFPFVVRFDILICAKFFSSKLVNYGWKIHIDKGGLCTVDLISDGSLGSVLHVCKYGYVFFFMHVVRCPTPEVTSR